MEINQAKIKKQKNHAFGKDIYLLGQDLYGKNYWLEAPRWDCGWYWGFGYIETYKNNKHPEKSKDIDGHAHWNGSIVGKNNSVNDGYCHNPYDCKLLDKMTFSAEEGWELAELFSQFYLLKDTAEYFGRGKQNIANTTIALYKKTELSNEINKERIPVITNRIMEILTP